MEQMIVGLVLFFGVHAVPMFPSVRHKIVNKVGGVLYQTVFALLSLAGLVLLVWGHASADYIELWPEPDWARHVTFLLMLPVLPILITAYLPGQLRRWIPHPMLMAVKIWAVAHLLVNGDLASVLLFGAFLVYGVLDLVSIKRRQRAWGQKVKIGPWRNDVIAVLLGLALYIGMVIWGHSALIGVALIG